MNPRTLAALFLLSIPTLTPAAPPEVIPVFPDLDPSLKSAETPDHRGTPAAPNTFIRDIQYPTLTLYLPDNAPSPTPAILICPGGGYAGVAIDKEGHAIAKWLNSLNIAALVLKYRMPQPAVTKDADPLPLQDARQSIRLARQNAQAWNLNPTQIGILGFSAGGHLASTLITHPQSPSDNPQSAIPNPQSSDANFAILLYPVISFQDGPAHTGSRTRLLGPSPTPDQLKLYSNELHVTPQTPPTFLVHAADDRVLPQNSLLFYNALRAHNVPAELHLFQSGGHGFGLGTPNSPPSQWPSLCATWLRTLKVLPPQPNPN